MSNEPAPIVNSHSARRLIVAPRVGGHGPTVGTFLVVWAVSTTINVSILLGSFFVFSAIGAAAGASDVLPEIQESTEVADTAKEYDLTNTDVGNDDAVPLNYNVDRIEE